MDIRPGPNQHLQHLLPGIRLPANAWSPNFSVDRQQLFFVQCAYGPDRARAPCSLKAQPVSGGASYTIYQHQTNVLEAVRVISPTRLLFIIMSSGNSDTSR